MILFYNKKIYSKVALLKAAYHFTDKAYIHLDSDDSNYIVQIEAKSDTHINEKDFENEILAQVVRYEVYQQTKNIREISLARALASSVIEENEAGTALVNENISIENILKDWFDEH